MGQLKDCSMLLVALGENRAAKLSRIFRCAAFSLSVLFATVTTSASADGADLSISGLIAHWKFDESSWTADCSTADITDSSGKGHHGTACVLEAQLNTDTVRGFLRSLFLIVRNLLANGPSSVPGKIGNAGRFDGIDQYANMGPGFNFSSSFTASLWLALDDYDSCGPTGKSQHIIGTHHLPKPNGNGRGWGIYWDCDGLAWELTNRMGSAIESYGYVQPLPFPANASWHHVALVYDSDVPGASLYWDGALVYSENGADNVPANLFDNGEPLTVNGLPYARSAGAPGNIDDVRIYDRALTFLEMRKIFDNR